jgi:hypothetical protein
MRRLVALFGAFRLEVVSEPMRAIDHDGVEQANLQVFRDICNGPPSAHELLERSTRKVAM